MRLIRMRAPHRARALERIVQLLRARDTMPRLSLAALFAFAFLLGMVSSQQTNCPDITAADVPDSCKVGAPPAGICADWCVRGAPALFQD